MSLNSGTPSNIIHLIILYTLHLHIHAFTAHAFWRPGISLADIENSQENVGVFFSFAFHAIDHERIMHKTHAKFLLIGCYGLVWILLTEQGSIHMIASKDQTEFAICQHICHLPLATRVRLNFQICGIFIERWETKKWVHSSTSLLRLLYVTCTKGNRIKMHRFLFWTHISSKLSPQQISLSKQIHN